MGVNFKIFIAEGLLVPETALRGVDPDDHDEAVKRFSQGGYGYAEAYSLFVWGDLEQSILDRKVGEVEYHFLDGGPYQKSDRLQGGAQYPLVVVLYEFRPEDPRLKPMLSLMSDKLRAVAEKGRHVRCLFSFYD